MAMVVGNIVGTAENEDVRLEQIKDRIAELDTREDYYLPENEVAKSLWKYQAKWVVKK